MSIAGISVVLCLLGAFQGVFLGMALLSVKQGNKIANRLLAALVFAASIVIFGGVMRSQNYILEVPHLSRIHDPFSYLLGPLLYLYLTTLIAKRTTFATKNFLHFIPFALCVVYLVPYFFLSTAAKLQAIEADRVEGSLGEWYAIRTTALIAQFLIYLVVIVWTLTKYSRGVKQNRRPIDRSVQFQIKYLVVAAAVLWIVGVVRYALGPDPSTNLLSLIGAAVTIYGLGYLRLVKPEILGGTDEARASSVKYENSTLSPRASERYLSKLLQIMESEKLYTDCDLSLPKVAERLSMPPHHLSQIINEQLNQSFSDFVNAYRVEEVKKKLLDPSKKYYSILAIAEESGFNSKSSFNTVFKKHTNTTPSEFRDKSSEVQNHNSARP